MAILINAINTAPALRPESDSGISLPKNHLNWVSGDVSYDIISFNNAYIATYYFQLRDTNTLLNTNLKYATPTRSYGSYEFFLNRYFVFSGFFTKDWQIINPPVYLNSVVKNYRFLITDTTEVNAELDNQGYLLTDLPWPPNTKIYEPPVKIYYFYMSFRIKLNPGVEIRLIAAV